MDSEYIKERIEKLESYLATAPIELENLYKEAEELSKKQYKSNGRKVHIGDDYYASIGTINANRLERRKQNVANEIRETSEGIEEAKIELYRMQIIFDEMNKPANVVVNTNNNASTTFDFDPFELMMSAENEN